MHMESRVCHQRSLYTNALFNAWPRQSGSRDSSWEDILSRAIESSDSHALGLLERWEAWEIACLKTDSRGLGALHVAVVFGRHLTLFALLNSGAVDVNQASTNAAKKGWTALHFAAFLMDLEAIKILLLYECDITLVTQLHSTPLHFATGRFRPDDHSQELVYSIMKTLIEAGVDPTATNSYGSTVMHESILWCDVTSLTVMLDQSTAPYFERLLLIGTAVLPHELAGRSPTLPTHLKRHLATAYFIQKEMKESAGVIQKLTFHDFQIYKNLESIANPSPTTVARIGLPNPESLSAREVGSLLQYAPQGFVVQALKYQESIQEYRHYSSGENRYVFPAYFSSRIPDWVCTDCRDCHIVAGRWLQMTSETQAKNFLVQLMIKVLSRASFSKSTPVDGNVFFYTEDQIQIRIQCIDRVRSVGVMIQVCCCESRCPETVAKCRNALLFVVQLAYELNPQISIGSMAVVSSKDLKAGKRIPHLFTWAAVNQAQASNKSFLLNPACLNVAETFVDLLLCDSHPHKYADPEMEIDVKKSSYYHSLGDMWRNDIYERAVKNHRDDLYMLMDAGVVADCLVSMGVFSSSDSDDVSSADNRCACLLAKIAEKQVYHHFFSTLLQTGHEKLWDILSRACEDINSSASLSDCDCAGVYLEEHMALHLSPIPEDTTAGPRYTACSGRITEESGYCTQNSRAHSRQLSYQSSHFSHGLDLEFQSEDVYVSEVSNECLDDSKDDQLETDRATTAASRTNSTVNSTVHSIMKAKQQISPPIDVPKRNSSSSSLTHLAEPAAAAVAPNGSPAGPKCLLGPRNFWDKLLTFLVPPADNVRDTVLPGIKQMF